MDTFVEDDTEGMSINGPVAHMVLLCIMLFLRGKHMNQN